MKPKKQELKAITEIDADGKMLAIASDDSPDRVGDSLDINKWDLKNFKKNPILLAGHDYRPEYVIGVAKNIRIEGNQLLFEPVFHSITELARNIGQMFKDGILRAWSVGFIPNGLMNPEDKSSKNELLEISAVSVPANANALMTNAKSYDVETINNVDNWVKDFSEIKTVIPYKDLGIADENEEWDGGKEVKESTAEDLFQMSAWYNQEEAENKSSYKLPHHRQNDKKAIWNGVKSAMGALLGARGGVDIPDDEKKSVYNHLSAHYKQFEKEIPEFKEYSDKEYADLFKEDAENDKIEIDVKEGKVISKKNRDKISSAIEQTKQAITALEELLELTENSKQEAKEVVETKVEKTELKKMPVSEKELAVRILKKIAGNSALALNKLK
jgi:hypothetical protein